MNYYQSTGGNKSERQLIAFLSGTIFFLLPWYYTDSGLPQPVDVPILLLAFVFFILRLPKLPYYFHHSQVFKVFLIFSLYVTSILLINFIVDNQEITLFLTLQNLYFVLLVAVFLSMINYCKNNYTRAAYLNLILKFLVIDSLIPLIYLFKTGIHANRIGLSFNNENQLGFFTLVNLSIFFYIGILAKNYHVKINKLLALYIININLFFLFLAASRACYPVILLYVLSYPLIFKINIHGFSRLLLWFLASTIIIFGIAFISYKMYLHMMDIRRAMNPTDFAGLFADFYFRAVKGISSNFSSNWYFLFGNGTYTVIGRERHLEFHNNFLATLNMVGIFGLFFYTYMNILITKDLLKKGFYHCIPFFCYLFYSMLHYSYRTRMNWILLVIFMFVIVEISRSNDMNAKGSMHS